MHMAKTRHRRRKKLPNALAVIDADNCTGCEACREMCPVDCIELRRWNLGVRGTESWCEVDLQRCIGCQLCILIPRRQDPYVLKVCPWDAIEMVPTERVPDVVAATGGPPEYVRKHRPRLIAAARQAATAR